MKKNTRAPLTASRRGEERSIALIYIFTAVIFAGLVGGLVFFLTAMSTSTRDAVLNQQNDYTLQSSTVVRGLFSIVALRYADEQGASCTLSQDYLRPAIMTLRFTAYEVPESCSVFVNDKLLTTEHRLEPDCRLSCDFQEFNRQFSIGLFDYRDNQNIKVCCNSICLEKQLNSLCTTALQ